MKLKHDKLLSSVASICNLRHSIKVAAPSRLQIYLSDGQPIMLDTSGKGDFLPTIFALWRQGLIALAVVPPFT